jgi:UDP-N-acetylmuramate--alanine ligase
MLDKAISYHLVGVGGSGMMPLALLLAARGFRVSGSDRSFDRDAFDPRRVVLEAAGVSLFAQSGGGGRGAVVVVSTAIEPDNPDLAGALAVRHRSEILSALVAESASTANHAEIILVAGSSGKTTTTAMIGWILQSLGRDPFVYVGGQVPGLASWGSRIGSGPMVVEVDESDGSIDRFAPEIAVVTSVSEDHKPLPEIEALFTRFLAKASRVVISGAALPLASRAGLEGEEKLRVVEPGAARSPLPGAFNRLNEAIAIATAVSAGADEDSATRALANFTGVARRLETVYRDDRRVVLDDFAHNPEKIAASLEAVHELGRPVIAIFQPHGYGPLRMHRDALARAFSEGLGERDKLILLPVFDAGGTADRSIRSEDLAALLPEDRVEVAPDRASVALRVCELAADSGTVVVMGARDATLPGFARMLGTSLSNVGPGPRHSGSQCLAARNP